MWEFKYPTMSADLRRILTSMRREMSEAMVIGVLCDIMSSPDFGVRDFE